MLQTYPSGIIQARTAQITPVDFSSLRKCAKPDSKESPEIAEVLLLHLVTVSLMLYNTVY